MSPVPWDLLVAAAIVGGSALVGGWAAGVGSPVLSDWGVSNRLRHQVLGAFRGLLVTLGVLAGLAWLQVDVTWAGALVVVAALAAVLGLRPVLVDVAQGVLLRQHPPFDVGDTVTVAGATGEVLRIGTASVTLRTDEGVEVTIAHRHLYRTPVRRMPPPPDDDA